MNSRHQPDQVSGPSRAGKEATVAALSCGGRRSRGLLKLRVSDLGRSCREKVTICVGLSVEVRRVQPCAHERGSTRVADEEGADVLLWPKTRHGELGIGVFESTNGRHTTCHRCLSLLTRKVQRLDRGSGDLDQFGIVGRNGSLDPGHGHSSPS